MKKPQDHFLAFVKAGLSLHPIGGAVASLLGDYLPSATEQAVKEFTAHFESRLAALEGRINATNVTTENFAELFKSAFLVVMRSHRKERLRAAANILTNSLLNSDENGKLSYTELDHFVRALDSLSSGALELLNQLAPSQSATEQHRRERINFDHLGRELGDPYLLMGLARELEAFNLVEISIPQIRTENYGNCTLVLTDLGKRFGDAVLRGDIDG